VTVQAIGASFRRTGVINAVLVPVTPAEAASVK
jgi:hypothetical protein